VTLNELAERSQAVLDQVERLVVGKSEPLRLVLMAVLAGGHVLLEDYPGLAKTLAARSFAQALGLSFKRIQFTPDLLPTDILGTYVLHRERGEFELRRGPIFAQLILADEINRATPRTQSALLEAMQERQVSLEGQTLMLPQPFAVVATQNPIEYEGTFPLPEAQIDRFLIRVRLGYPGTEAEVEMLERRIARRVEQVTLEPVCDADELLSMQAAVEDVRVDRDLLQYMTQLSEATREHASVEVGASPRGTLALLSLSRARAAMEARDYVIPDDIKQAAVPALAHRLIIRPELWQREIKPEEVVARVVDSVAVPKAERWTARAG